MGRYNSSFSNIAFTTRLGWIDIDGPYRSAGKKVFSWDFAVEGYKEKVHVDVSLMVGKNNDIRFRAECPLWPSSITSGSVDKLRRAVQVAIFEQTTMKDGAEWEDWLEVEVEGSNSDFADDVHSALGSEVHINTQRVKRAVWPDGRIMKLDKNGCAVEFPPSISMIEMERSCIPATEENLAGLGEMQSRLSLLRQTLAGLLSQEVVSARLTNLDVPLPLLPPPDDKTLQPSEESARESGVDVKRSEPIMADLEAKVRYVKPARSKGKPVLEWNFRAFGAEKPVPVNIYLVQCEDMWQFSAECSLLTEPVMADTADDLLQKLHGLLLSKAHGVTGIVWENWLEVEVSGTSRELTDDDRSFANAKMHLQVTRLLRGVRPDGNIITIGTNGHVSAFPLPTSIQEAGEQDQWRYRNPTERAYIPETTENIAALNELVARMALLRKDLAGFLSQKGIQQRLASLDGVLPDISGKSGIGAPRA